MSGGGGLCCKERGEGSIKELHLIKARVMDTIVVYACLKPKTAMFHKHHASALPSSPECRVLLAHYFSSFFIYPSFLLFLVGADGLILHFVRQHERFGLSLYQC